MCLRTDKQPGTYADPSPANSVSTLIRRYLQLRHSGSPARLAEWLAQFNVHLEPKVIHALLAAMKTG